MFLINLLGEIGGAKTLKIKNNEAIMAKIGREAFQKYCFLTKNYLFCCGIMKGPKLDH